MRRRLDASTPLPLTREQALAAGSSLYQSGRACRWAGHTGPRQTSTGKCAECAAAASVRYAKSGRFRPAIDRDRINDLARDRYHRDVGAARKACLDKYYRSHARGIQVRREYRDRNSAKEAARSRLKRQRHREKIAASNRLYKQSNRHIYAAAQKARETRLSRAMPAWADRQAIALIYAEARRVTIATGIEHQVDHIAPLNSPLCCGLHVPWNLRVITKADNVRKSNRVIEELACEYESSGAVSTAATSP